MRTFTREVLSRKVRVTVRVVDGWARSGILLPTGFDGAYSMDDAAVAAVLARLARLGASVTVLRAVTTHLRARPCIGWPTRIYVTKDGTLAMTASGLEDGGWVVPTRSDCCAAAA